ncbi:uncharacterized protein FPRO_16048 [Fusarium proliferatum ET1]|uniref:Uncharacterized protein n=1 Tax=Fusarium proliferatum (strain ET1) TaxID=1227346 RepID=A0A1L7WB69_FUSPR|nr:uncharacterized protein FPRO_16048 [Fusarium proliferatum ET1]CZR49840.1 uncharacterized protein FPRO_16048 [Fusarium proliferatum ET1]
MLLQESWIAHTKTRCLTKTHPAYDICTPVEIWDTDQIRPFQTRDILWIMINSLMVVNFNRQNDEKDALILDLLNTVGIQINPHGNTIDLDLAFTNIPLAEAIVEDHLATSSDHLTLSVTLPDIKPAPIQPGKIRLTTEDELKRFAEIVELGAINITLTDSTPAELGNLTKVAAQLSGSQKSTPTCDG